MNSNTLQLIKNLNPKVKNEFFKLEENHMKINGETYTLEGENISHKVNSTLEVKMNRKNNLVSKNLLGNHEIENGGFVFLFYQTNKAIKERVPTLSKPDITRLLYLLTFIDYNNRLIHDNNKPIHKNDLIKLLQLSPKRANSFINSLIESDILIVNSKGLYIGEWIGTRGTVNQKELKKNSASYTRMFRKTVRELFEKSEVRNLGRLSTIYLILPYLNLATNIVSVNPDESDIDNVIPIKLLELANVLEYGDYRKLKAALNKIKIGNDYAFGFVEFEGDRRTMRIIVNPKIVFAGNYDQLQAIKALFN